MIESTCLIGSQSSSKEATFQRLSCLPTCDIKGGNGIDVRRAVPGFVGEFRNTGTTLNR